MNIANKVSTFRILNVPFFIAALVYYSPERDYLRYVALIIFSLAVFSDFLDGYLARKIHLQTKAGQVLDPLADKLLLMSAYILLYFVSPLFPSGVSFPLWVIFIVISRDIIILLGTVVIYMVKGGIEIRPSYWGKFSTFFQMSAVISMLLQWEFSPLVWSFAILFTLISGAGYINRGFQLLYYSNNTH